MNCLIFYIWHMVLKKIASASRAHTIVSGNSPVIFQCIYKDELCYLREHLDGNGQQILPDWWQLLSTLTKVDGIMKHLCWHYQIQNVQPPFDHPLAEQVKLATTRTHFFGKNYLVKTCQNSHYSPSEYNPPLHYCTIMLLNVLLAEDAFLMLSC